MGKSATPRSDVKPAERLNGPMEPLEGFWVRWVGVRHNEALVLDADGKVIGSLVLFAESHDD